MGDINVKSSNLSSYIREVESKERARRRNIVIAFSVLLLLGAVGSASFLFKSGTGSLRTVAYEDLNIDKVSALFESDNTELIVEYRNQPLTPDTIRSIDEYLAMLVSSERSAMNFEQISRFEPQESLAEDSVAAIPPSQGTGTPVAPMQPYSFAIEGDRKVGKEILFAIQDYNTAISYTLDFGNGVRKQVGKFTRYNYPHAGNFLINLIATNSNNATSTNSRFITITPEQEEVLLASAGEETIALPPAIEPLETNTPAPTLAPISANAKLVTDSGTPKPTMPVSEPKTLEMTLETAPEAAITTPLITAQKMPEFPGGREAMSIFLRKKIRYPSEAIRNKVEGRVYLRFVVEADGSVSNPIIVKGIGYGCDQEAIRLVGLMPKWTPGQQNGRNVPVYAEFLVNFKFIE